MNAPLTFDFLRSQIVGIDSAFETPFGRRLMVYCDYTASGRCLLFVERYLQRIAEVMDQAAAQGTTCRARLTAIVHAILTQPVEERAILRLASQELSNISPEARSRFLVLYHEKFIGRLAALIETGVAAGELHVAFGVTWNVYQDVIDAYQAEQPAEGKKIMTRLIDTLKNGVPAGLAELRTLGRTLHRRRDDILAFFDHPGTSNGPSEAINGLLEHLRGTARGFRNIVNYIARSLLDAGGFRPLTHSLL